MPAPVQGEFAVSVIRKFDRLDASVCRLLNRSSRVDVVRRGFGLISRLGDGVLWYLLMALLPLVAGREGALISLQMGVTAIAGALIYKQIKSRFGRERPYVSHDEILCAVPPLDRFSFPSGHTLHAVSFSSILCVYYPVLALVLMPFTLLVALSRMILGLHYPTDVLVGAAIGAALALFSFQVTGYPLNW
jgi:undecaprenyl-diphosphatase